MNNIDINQILTHTDTNKFQSYEFIIQTAKEHIDYINKIIEAYEGVGVVRTISAADGLIDIIVTQDYVHDMRDIIADINNNHCKAEILEFRKWIGDLY